MNEYIVCLISLFCVVSAGAQNDCNPAWAAKKTNPLLEFIKKYSAQQPEKSEGTTDLSTLKLLHVVFRHGDRTTDPDTKYPNDPYNNETYYPVGYGQLTNLGKTEEYNIGTALRKQYGDFLGDVYLPESVDARSTDVNRTKMSLELALAGLFPPVGEQIWNPALNWQPIPYNYYRKNEDLLLGDLRNSCPKYNKLYNKNLLSEQNQEQDAKLKDLYNYLSKYTGETIDSIEDAYLLYFVLYAEEQWGFTLPEWTKCIWPDKLTELAIDFYDLFTQTQELKQFATGFLLKKIWDDSINLKDGKLEPAGRKIFLYSGHERNVALVLIALNLFYPHIPPYSSYVVFELHEINGTYGYKIYYQNYQESEPKLMKIPGCDTFCALEDFYNLFKDDFPVQSCTDLLL